MRKLGTLVRWLDSPSHMQVGERLIHLILRLMRSARHTVLVQGNSLPKAVYDDDRVLEAIQKASKKDVLFRFLVGPNFQTGSTTLLDIFVDTTYVSKAPLLSTFVVVDSMLVYYETAHPSGAPGYHSRKIEEAPESAALLISLFEKTIRNEEIVVPLRKWSLPTGKDSVS